jgi:hypothetical protein
VRAEAQGFKPIEQSGVILDAATRRAVDFTLVAGLHHRGRLRAAAAQQVQTSSGDVSKLITERQLTQIALNGRNYVQMPQLVPGVVATSTDAFSLGLNATAQRVNGIRTNSLYFMVDGTDNMDNGANSNAIINPNIDAIGEIKSSLELQRRIRRPRRRHHERVMKAAPAISTVRCSSSCATIASTPAASLP